MDLLQDLQEPDRNVGAGEGEEEEEEPGNASSDASEAAALLLQTEVGQCEVSKALKLLGGLYFLSVDTEGPIFVYSRLQVVNNKASGDSATPGHSSAVTPTLEHTLLTDLTEVVVATDKAAAKCNDAGWYWLGSIVGQGDEAQGEATYQALNKLMGMTPLCLLFVKFLGIVSKYF